YLAEGGFGKVYKAKWYSSMVVLKSLSNSQDIKADFLQEIAYYKLFNKNDPIVGCYGISQDPETKNYLMVMEYMREGNLRQYINSHQYLNENVYEYEKQIFLDFKNKVFPL